MTTLLVGTLRVLGVLELHATSTSRVTHHRMGTTSPAYPPPTDNDGLQLRLNAFSRCLDTASLQKAYNTWLLLNKGVAAWSDLERWVQQQLPTIDLVHNQYEALVAHEQEPSVAGLLERRSIQAARERVEAVLVINK
jgi:hypothetical protein